MAFAHVSIRRPILKHSISASALDRPPCGDVGTSRYSACREGTFVLVPLSGDLRSLKESLRRGMSIEGSGLLTTTLGKCPPRGARISGRTFAMRSQASVNSIALWDPCSWIGTNQMRCTSVFATLPSACSSPRYQALHGGACRFEDMESSSKSSVIVTKACPHALKAGVAVGKAADRLGCDVAPVSTTGTTASR